jgi:hypothetical protein
MGSTQAELQKFFKNVGEAFNKRDEDLERFLEENATVYSVEHHKAYHGKAKAAAYLKQQYNDNPKFTDRNMKVTVNKSGTGGIIQGTLTWTDKDHKDGEKLMFCYTFVYKKRNENDEEERWYISTLWAA